MLITRKSPFTGKTHTKDINCTQEQMDKYMSGQGYIQHIFPHLSADDREFIKTGITKEEWNETFKEEEEGN